MLFELAPIVALKFRGVSRRSHDRVLKGALASHVVTLDTAGEALRVPILAFSFTYLAAHFVLDLISEEEVAQFMDSLEALYSPDTAPARHRSAARTTAPRARRPPSRTRR